MSRAAATACTCTPRCRLNRTAASLNSALYSCTFFGPARGIDTSGLLGRSVYKSEGGFPASFKRLLGSPIGSSGQMSLIRERAQNASDEGPLTFRVGFTIKAMELGESILQRCVLIGNRRS